MSSFQKLKTIFISFEDPISKSELRAFRSAIVEKAGRKHILFHNHIDDRKYLYSYPKIQYKIIHNKPCIICINEGIDEIHHFFTKPSWDLMLYDRLYKVKVQKLIVNQFNMQVWDTFFHYNIYNWHALNQNNFKKFISITSIDEQYEMLRKILIGNILSFAKGINWTIDKEIKVNITEVIKKKIVKFKNIKIASFDVNFSTNVFLPNYIGLGKNVSYGFGIVKQIKKQQNYEQQ